ncbi:MAG: hypothetical protein AB1589_14160 [Cyanobacteriota bacterium]
MGMKCIRCETDNNLRDRTASLGRCKRCGHPFAFEPSTVTDTRFRFTDKFFAKAITDISDNEALYFTPKQLFYLLERRLSSRLNAASGLYFLYAFANFIAWIVGNSIFQGLGDSILLSLWLLINIFFIFYSFKSTQNSSLNYRNRKSITNLLKIIGGLILGIGILVAFQVNSYLLFVITVLIGMLSLYLGFRPLKNKAAPLLFSESQFQSWVTRWTRANISMPKMLIYRHEATASTTVSPDISAYSFDRAVICDNPAIAQMLIANNFHFENNCAVLSITGYPQSIFDTVMQMLRRNLDLKVYALHDASPSGVSLIHQLRTHPDWFQNSNVMIYDLGLRPRQIFNLRSAFVQASEESVRQAKQLPAEVRQRLSQDELAWLEAGNVVELESFSPRKIIQVLNQGIVRSQEAPDRELFSLIDDRYEGEGYIYAVDSFG